MQKLKNLSKKQIVLITIVSLCLCAAAIVSVIFFANGTSEKSFERKDEQILSEDSSVAFRDDVKIAFADADIQKNLKGVYVNETGQYTLKYRKKIPEFFSEMKKGEVFCVYPDGESHVSYFNMGFCGKLAEDPGETEIVFEIPKIYEVFKKLKVETGENNFEGVSFYPNKGVELQTLSVSQPGTSEPIDIDETIKLFGTEATFGFKENDLVPLKEDYQILCKQLKIKFKQKIDPEFNIDGSVTLDYPSLKFLLDYNYDENKEEININDYSFDFITKEKVNLKISGNKSIDALQHSEDLPEKISPVNIIDVTESEEGKFVLGTYVIGYNVKLPDIKPFPSLNNTENDVGYLSLGIAVQLAVTAKGEVTIESSYEQAGFLNVHADKSGNITYEVKGYEYPHPVIDERAPNGSREQEIPFVTSSYAGEMDFKAGVSLDTGFCILGMIPMKLCNGIETEIKGTFDSAREDEIKIAENSYITSHDIDYFKTDIYSDLKIHLGAKIKGFNNYLYGETGAVIQIFRKNLIQLPNPLDFDISQCRFAGIQLGQTYNDSEMRDALSEYALNCDGYTYVDYSTDIAVDSMLNEALSAFNISAEELLDEFELEYPNCKINYYSSGAIFIRDSSNQVKAIILLKDKIRNDAGLRVGLVSSEIEQLYSTPDESVSAEFNIGPFFSHKLGLEKGDINLNLLKYRSKANDVTMDILSQSNESKVIIISELQQL